MTTSLFRLTHHEKCEQFAGIPGPDPSFPMGNAGDFIGALA